MNLTEIAADRKREQQKTEQREAQAVARHEAFVSVLARIAAALERIAERRT